MTRKLEWPEEPPTQFGAFWTDSAAWWCWLIRRITHSRWAHVGIWFGWPDGCKLRAEALTDGFVRQRGVAGPMDWASLEAFAARLGCAAIWSALPADRAAVAAMYAEARILQRFASYSEAQLLAMWARERLGRRVPQDETRLVCSEYLSRVAAAGGLDMRDPERSRHDEVTPGSSFARALELGAKPVPVGAPTRPQLLQAARTSAAEEPA